jgi:hypothetical protein
MFNSMNKQPSSESLFIQALNLALSDWAARRASAVASPPSDAFLARARQAARRAESIRSLGDAARKVGFEAVPLPDYLAKVARTARVNLGRLLSLRPSGDSPALPWISLAKSIGLDCDRIKLLTRLWIANHCAHVENVPSVFARGVDTRASTDIFSQDVVLTEPLLQHTLDALETKYDSETMALLKFYLTEIER